MQIEYSGSKALGVFPMQHHTARGKLKSISLPGAKEGSPVPVSAVIITLNEAAIIGQALSRLWWCDEIIVIDSGSTDKTVEICEEHGCIVYFRAFKGFGEQKNFGVSKTQWWYFRSPLLSRVKISYFQNRGLHTQRGPAGPRFFLPFP